jgi:prepilin-type N-terminal cleavage/methylation domain-containing protein
MHLPFSITFARGFSLVELLLVITIIAVLSYLASVAVQSVNTASSFSQGISDLSNLLVQARVNAMGNNTYVYMGIKEISSPQAPNSNVGEVVVAIVASQDGTRPYHNSPGAMVGTALAGISRLSYFNNLHVTSSGSLSTSGGMARPVSSTTCIVEDISNAANLSAVTFPWPLTGTATYTFGSGTGTPIDSVIEFDPQGVARIEGATYSSAIPSYIEIALQPTHGGNVNSNGANQGAIQLDGMTGAVTVYRP